MRESTPSPMQAAAFERHTALNRESAHNTQVSLSFGRRLEPDAARSAWIEVVARNPVLRSVFSRRPDGSARMRELDGASILWQTEDWRNGDIAQIAETWPAFLTADALAPVEFTSGAPVRVTELLLPGDGLHHLITFPSFLLDEESITMMLAQWLVLLDGGQLPEFEPPGETSVPSPDIWREILSGSPAVMSLRVRGTGSVAATSSLRLGRETTDAFKSFCKSLDLDPAAVMHGLWALVARRHGARGDVSFFSDSIGASMEALGHRENLLPVPHVWTGSVSEWLAGFASRRELARKNGAIDASAVLSTHGVETLTGGVPVHFSWRRPEINEAIRSAFPHWINFDARLRLPDSQAALLEVRDGVRLGLRVSIPSCPVSAVEEILARIEKLLGELPGLADKPVRNVPVLTPQETKHLRGLSRGEEGSAGASSVGAAFHAISQRRDAHSAVVDGEYALSYRELDALSDRLAGHLVRSGFAGGWQAGLFLSQSSWIAIAVLGTLKAGNTIVPINPSAPPEWAEKMLQMHDCGIVLCDAASAPLLDASNRRRLVLDQEWETIESAEFESPRVTPDSPAAILTGFPDSDGPTLRGLTHGSILSACSAASRISGFGEDSAFLAHTAAGSGGFLQEWLLPLLTGGRVVVADNGNAHPARMSGVSHLRITTPQWVNAAAAALRDEPVADAGLRCVLVECGTPHSNAATVWNNVSPGRSKVFYSPAGFCGLGLAGEAETSTGYLPAGLPCDDNEIVICDEDGHDIPCQFVGQLLLRFPGWKKLGESVSKRGFAAGLDAWRDENGVVSLEGTENGGNGIQTNEQRSRAAVAIGSSLDVHVGERIWTVGGLTGPLNLGEWPLGVGGWIDDDALPRPGEHQSKPVIAEKPVVQARREPWSPLLVLNEHGPGTRLVLVPGAAGEPDVFRPLASAIGATRRIVAVRSRGLSGLDEAHPTVESAAAAYLDVILEDEPGEPFVLAGFGFGATVALEMARQLHTAGRPEPVLVLAGGLAPRGDNTGWLSSVRSAWRRLAEQTDPEPAPASTGLAAAHAAAWRRYRFTASPLDADLIAPSDFSKEAIGEWQSLLPGLHVEPMKCRWTEMLSQPAVKRLAVLLEERH